MRKFYSISLLGLMAIVLFPWQLVCITHPFGEEHHHHDGPSPCDIHRMVSQQPGEHLLPPMQCEHVKIAIGDYDQTQVEKIVPTIQLIAVVAVLFDLVSFEITEQPFLLPPDPKCRSAPLLTDNPLRAPPLV